MADYRTITDAEVDPDAPLTSSLGYAWRDNPIAIAEGATRAPRILDRALSDTVTGAGTTWVMDRIIPRNAGGIGTYVLAEATGSERDMNQTIEGSSLRPTNAAGDTPLSTLSGTWRLHGYISGQGANSAVSLFIRIS